MPSTTIQAHLLFAGHSAQLGSTLLYVEQWITHNLRPDLPDDEYLPDIGDNPIEANIIASQSVVASKLDMLFCKSITEQEYLEGEVRGTIYTVSYDDAVSDQVFNDPTADDNVVMSISSAAQVDTYQPDPASATASKIWVKNRAGAYEIGKNLVISKICALINVSTTKKYRNKTASEIIDIGKDAGNINAEGMWGQEVGTILYNGHSAAPVQEQDPVTRNIEINWNVTNNYQIKYLPGIGLDTWQYVFYDGSYSQIYSNNTGTVIELYPKTTLPNDLP